MRKLATLNERAGREIIGYAMLAVEVLKKHYTDDLCAVAMFGSTVRGDFNLLSDIDLLVVIKQCKTCLATQIDICIDLTRQIVCGEKGEDMRKKGLPYDFGWIVYTLDRFRRHPPVLLDMTTDSIALYDPHSIFQDEIHKVIARMRELGSKKVMLPDGRWYWILKPDIKFGEKFEI